jgi:hypothetical protein
LLLDKGYPCLCLSDQALSFPAPSPDGGKIFEKRQLHKTILDMEHNPENHPTAGFHTHILSEVPEDTDVFFVLNRGL